MPNLLYSLPSELQKIILTFKYKLEFNDVLQECKIAFIVSRKLLKERQRFFDHNVNNKEYISRNVCNQVQSFERSLLRTAEFYNIKNFYNIIFFNYVLQRRNKRFQTYQSIRNPWCYSWVTCLPYLDNWELKLHCDNNNMTTTGSRSDMIHTLLSI